MQEPLHSVLSPLPSVLRLDDLSRLLQVHLEGEGYEVALASDGEEALRRAASLPPHAIVLDIMLPDRSGIEVCRDLRKLSSTSLVPILFLTGRGDVDTEREGFAAGGDDYLVKPVDPERVAARLASRLQRSAVAAR